MSLLYTIIFISGGAILALELLASRVMTPYFGVSLYIWTGILSITLIALALGYWAGGRIAGADNGPGATGRLVRLYVLMPALSAIAIVAACLAYPFLFTTLAGWNLVFGAFAACLVLLFLPLVATSAMNPLLVAIALRNAGPRAGDAGAGRVFFVSTIGSVAGVLVTAFGMIPYLSNFTAVLTVALVLALLSLAATASTPRFAARGRVGVIAAAAALGAALLLWQADAYTGRYRPVAYGDATWRVEASYGSLFGTVKILKSDPDGDTGRYRRIYFQDGLVQNSVDSRGKSLSFYTYALEALAYAYRPDLRTALVLGLGAGIVPARLAGRGAAVDVAEIDPVSLRVARRYFGFDAAAVRVHQADARTYVRNCPRRFDVIVVVLFHGDGTPDYLVTREFFHDLRNCLAGGGIAVFNTFADLDHPVAYAHLLATLRVELPHIVLYRPDWPGAVQINSFVVAGAAPLPAPAKVTLDDVPELHSEALWDMLAHPRPLDEALLAGGIVMTDARNAAAYDLAAAQLLYRRAVVTALPPAFLLN